MNDYERGYRRGVEDAARVADESANGYQSDALRVAAEAGRETEPAWDLHGRALAVWSVAQRIRALAPAPSAAPATKIPKIGELTWEQRMAKAPSASGGDEARCEHDIPLTMRCAWCEHA